MSAHAKKESKQKNISQIDFGTLDALVTQAKELLTAEKRDTQKDEDGRSPLLQAAERGDLDTVKQLMEGAQHGKRAIHLEELAKSFEAMAQCLRMEAERLQQEDQAISPIEKRFNKMDKDHAGMTALLLAAYKGRINVVTWLLTNKHARINEKADGKNALLWAAHGYADNDDGEISGAGVTEEATSHHEEVVEYLAVNYGLLENIEFASVARLLDHSTTTQLTAWHQQYLARYATDKADIKSPAPSLPGAINSPIPKELNSPPSAGGITSPVPKKDLNSPVASPKKQSSSTKGGSMGWGRIKFGNSGSPNENKKAGPKAPPVELDNLVGASSSSGNLYGQAGKTTQSTSGPSMKGGSSSTD